MSGYRTPIIIFIGLIVLLAIGLKWNHRDLPSPLIGREIPYMNATNLFDENDYFSLDMVENRVWILNVFASWCSGCYQEHNALTAMINDNDVIAIGLNYKDDNTDARKWLESLGNPYDFIIADHNGLIGIDWGVYGVPETFIVDKKGIIRHKHIGPLNERVIRDSINPLLARINAEK